MELPAAMNSFRYSIICSEYSAVGLIKTKSSILISPTIFFQYPEIFFRNCTKLIRPQFAGLSNAAGKHPLTVNASYMVTVAVYTHGAALKAVAYIPHLLSFRIVSNALHRILPLSSEVFQHVLRSSGKLYSGRGISTDIIGASIHAYVNALNKIVYEEAGE